MMGVCEHYQAVNNFCHTKAKSSQRRTKLYNFSREHSSEIQDVWWIPNFWRVGGYFKNQYFLKRVTFHLISFIYKCRSWSDCANRKWTNWIFNEFKWRDWWQKQQHYIIYRSLDWTSLFSPSCYEKKQERQKTSICKTERSFIIKNFDLYCLHDGMLS